MYARPYPCLGGASAANLSLTKMQVKCDEAKPQCRVCRDDGLECPGFERQLRWSTKHERLRKKGPEHSAGHLENSVANHSTRSTKDVGGTREQTVETTNAGDDRTGDSTTATEVTRGTIHLANGQLGSPRNPVSDASNAFAVPRTPSSLAAESASALDDAGIPVSSHFTHPVGYRIPHESQQSDWEWPNHIAANQDPFSVWCSLGGGYNEAIGLHDLPNMDSILESQSPYNAPAPWRDGSYMVPAIPGLGLGDPTSPLHRENMPDEFSGPLPAVSGPVTSSHVHPVSQSHARLGEERREADTQPRRSISRYLQTYYRITAPSEMTGFSDSDLICYYFDRVCPLLSCFDSPLNPFQVLVSKHLHVSKTLGVTSQSLAVVHLVNHYPSLGPLATRKRAEAWRSLQRDLYLNQIGKISTDYVMLNLILLGLSSSWHRPLTLGMSYLCVARSLLQQSIKSGGYTENSSFFEGALMYWEMLASFVDPLPIVVMPGQLSMPDPNDDRETPVPVMPHPLSGIATMVDFALAEIGRILRRHQCPPAYTSTGKRVAVSLDLDEDWATKLEDLLQRAKLPYGEDIADYHDGFTSKDSLLQVASAYRLAGLMELYQLYPRLLSKRCAQRLNLDGFTFDDHEICMREEGSTFERSFAALMHKLAKHVSDKVSRIPISSAASRRIPLVYVICARYMHSGDTMTAQDNVTMEDRRLIEDHMMELSRKYPQEPMQMMIRIIREVWQRNDDGSPHSHWMYVMHEKEWQNLMG